MIHIETNGIRHILEHPVFDRIRFEEQVRQFLEELAAIGIQDAAANFSEAEYDGTNDVKVDPEPQWVDDHTLRIRARGESILFIEFGTGVYNPVKHPKADELGMIRGEYGLGHGKQRAWAYYGDKGTNGIRLGPDNFGVPILTRGNNANMSMYKAAEEMRKNIEDIARRVFVP